MEVGALRDKETGNERGRQREQGAERYSEKKSKEGARFSASVNGAWPVCTSCPSFFGDWYLGRHFPPRSKLSLQPGKGHS